MTPRNIHPDCWACALVREDEAQRKTDLTCSIQ